MSFNTSNTPSWDLVPIEKEPAALIHQDDLTRIKEMLKNDEVESEIQLKARLVR
jgi:hypothetical protein